MEDPSEISAKSSTVGSRNLSALGGRSRRPSGVSSLPTTPLPEKELKFLFDFNDVGRKGYLTKQELFNVIDRLRKRDRIETPLSSAILNSVYFLLDPSQQDQVTWAAFSSKFNTFFWQNRIELYCGSTAAGSSSEIQGPSGVFVKQSSVRTPRQRHSLSLSLGEIPAAEPPVFGQSASVSEDAPRLSPSASSVVTGEGTQARRRASVAPFVALPALPPTTPPSPATPSPAPDEPLRKDQSPLTPEPRQPPGILPERLRLSVRVPQLEPQIVAEKLAKVPGLPEVAGTTRWVGRVRSAGANEETMTPFLRCPNCNFQIDPAVVERQRREWNSFYRDRQLLAEATPPPSTYIPLYGPYFYSGMWEFGRVVGVIPPSFFSSPYNIHTWTFKRTLA